MAAKRKRSDEVTGGAAGVNRSKSKQISRNAQESLAGDDVANRFVDDVRAILREARGKAYAAANTIMVEAYWRIGQRIVEEEQGGEYRAEYGSFLLRDLSRRLGEEFGRGVSVSNLRNFRQFYLTFPLLEKRYALRSELTWTHWRMIMRVEDTRARDYYIRECAQQGWTTSKSTSSSTTTSSNASP